MDTRQTPSAAAAIDPSRRQLLLAAAIGSVAVATTSCDLLATDPESDPATRGEGDAGALEAPQLAEQVAAGDLPPLAERLPSTPLVVEPMDGVTSYGGTWNDLLLGQSGTDLYRALAYDTLLRWDPEWREIMPNIAESWEVSDDGTEYTFHLVQGIKWSDGEPFTAADIGFAYEGIIVDPDLTPTSTQEFLSGGEMARFEQVDDFTVRFTFVEPHGLFLDRLASPGFATSRIILPRHYFAQFHPDFDDGAEDRAKEAGYDDWREFFLSKGGGGTIATEYWANPEIPTVFAWRVRRPLTQTLLEVERNPYYWKVDPDGRQLPYLDAVRFTIVNNAETMLLKATNGEADFNVSPYGFCTLANKPVLARNRESGNFEFVEVTDSRCNYLVVQLNLNHKNEVFRELFQKKDFRIGLSHAINRQEVLNVVFQRQGEPWQVAPRPQAVFYNEEFAKQYTEYDVDRAAQHLDAAGLTDRNADGLRLLPNGEPVSFAVLTTPDSPEYTSTLELIKNYWRDVGVDLQIATVSGDLLVVRKGANEYDATLDTAFYGMQDAVLYPNWFFPHRPDTAFAPLWGEWYETGGERGEEPPAQVRQQMELYDEVKLTASVQRREELFTELLAISQEQFYVIGTGLPTGAYGIVKNNLRNVPRTMPYGWVYPTPGPTMPEQYSVGT